MWNDRINEFLDGDRDLEEATKEEKKEILMYRRIVAIYATRLDYVPSAKGKEEFLKKIKRKKRGKYIWWSIAAAAVFFGLFIPLYVIPTVKEKNLMAMEPQKRIETRMEKVREIKIDMDSVRTVMDGF
jgi:hypothetical protein